MTASPPAPTPTPLVILAPAKVNLHLAVVGRRPDGLHELLTLFWPIEFYDRLDAAPQSAGEGIEVRCNRRDVPNGPANLAYRAAETVLEGTGLGARIRIEKRIPAAAGLGGGSSDAGSLMAALNRRWGLGLSHEELVRRAARLGADVPFFLDPVPSLARGVGEILAPIESRVPPKERAAWRVVIADPGVPVPAGWAYGALGLAPGEKHAKDVLTTGELTNRYDAFIAGGDPSAGLLRNDLEAAVAARRPEIAAAREALKKAGAEGILMSGSGSCVFGLFRGDRAALAAARRIGVRFGAHPARPLFADEDSPAPPDRGCGA